MCERVQKFKGNLKPDWKVIAEVQDTESGLWLIQVGPKEGEWRNFKLSHSHHTERKANYWLAWNGERFARNKDAELLALRTSLNEQVMQTLQNFFSHMKGHYHEK